MTYQRKNAGAAPVRSVRVPDHVWDRVRTRADHEGVTPSYVMGLLLEGYALGKINLPRITVQYTQDKSA